MGINNIHKQIEEEELTEDEKLTLQALFDPVLWAEQTLKDPDNPTKSLKLRYYQKDTIRYQPKETINEKGEKILINRMKCYRFGRRIGKTTLLAIEALWHACTNHNFKILYIAPYESQVNIFFSMIEKLIAKTAIVPKRFVRKPFIVEFNNGSKITGHTANVRSTRKGSTIRGEEGDLIIIDEADHGIDEVINEVIMPIYLGNDKAMMIGSSTPTGRRGIFYTWNTEGEKIGIKPFHYPSQVSPRWTDEAERLARKTMTRDQYIHEIEASFGSALEGVFKHKDLDSILKKYYYENLKFDRKNNYYIMGIDWNEQYGTCIVILERNKKTGRFRIFRNEIVPKQEFTQLEGVSKIVGLHENFPCDFVYADHGYGQTNIELLKKYGLENKMSRLDYIVKDIDYGGTILIRDPVTGKEVKKPAKPFLVDNAVLFVESRNMDIPEDEDTEFGLIGQMRNFCVTKFSKTGHPVYEGKLNGRDNDHSLNAFMLALLGFTLEYGDISKYEVSIEVAHIKNMFAKAGYVRDNVQSENVTKFKHLLSRVAPNFKPEGQRLLKKQTAFISSEKQSRRMEILSRARRKKFGLGRDNI